MYGEVIVFFAAMMLLLVGGNFFLERAFKKKPELRPRFYLLLLALGYSWLGTAVLAIFIRPERAALIFPLLFALVLFIGADQIECRLSELMQLVPSADLKSGSTMSTFSNLP
jgi:hypothetical protein